MFSPGASAKLPSEEVTDQRCDVVSVRLQGEVAAIEQVDLGSRKTVELEGGSHTVGIPEAAQVVDLIREAASATTGQ